MTIQPPNLTPHYSLVLDGEQYPVDTVPRDSEGFGAIMAVNEAQRLSTQGAPCTVYLGERLLCRYEQGRRCRV